MAITTNQVKALRDRTGVSIMQCKKALEEASGDVEKAVVILRKQSGTVAAKKSDRSLGAGVVSAYVHSNNEVAAVVTLSCETDFVAKNPDFVSLAYNIAMHIAAQNPEFQKSEDIDANAIKAAKEVFAKEVKDKPEKMQDQILDGKLKSYFKDKVLLEQVFIKDQEKSVADLINEATQKFGERIEIKEFSRLNV
jgi:elongation factor Ts